MRKIYTLLTDKGPRYTALESVTDIFVTPAHADIKHVAAAFSWTVGQARNDAAEHVIDVQSTAIDLMEVSLSRLESGLSLIDEEALIVDGIYTFLHGALAPHQRDVRLMTGGILEKWVYELNVREPRMRDWPVHDIVHDIGLWNAVHRPCSELKYPGADWLMPRVEPTRGQNMLAGRYMRSFVYAAKLCGPNRLSPIDIVDAWHGKNRVIADNCTFLDEVLGVLIDNPTITNIRLRA